MLMVPPVNINKTDFSGVFSLISLFFRKDNVYLNTVHIKMIFFLFLRTKYLTELLFQQKNVLLLP